MAVDMKAAATADEGGPAALMRQKLKGFYDLAGLTAVHGHKTNTTDTSIQQLMKAQGKLYR
jgi:hypothetical protein